MTNVLFRVNLGSVDAARLDIADFRECLVGKEVAVPDAAAKALEKAGVASIVEVIPPPKPSPTPKPVEVKADPAVESGTELAADPVADPKKKK